VRSAKHPSQTFNCKELALCELDQLVVEKFNKHVQDCEGHVFFILSEEMLEKRSAGC
jgi:hypothetical protein